MVNRMRKNNTNISVYSRALASLSTLALLSGCAANSFDDFPNQLSAFFKNAGVSDNSARDENYGEYSNENSLNIAANNVGAGDESPARPPARPNASPGNDNDLSHMLERVAETALSNNNYGAAARIYGRSHDLAPKRPGPALGLARASSKIGDHRSSIKAYQAVLALMPSHEVALREIARELMDLGAPKDAIPYMQTALTGDPADPRLRNELGIAHDLTGNHEAAQKQFHAGLILAPGDLTLRANLGRSMAFSGRPAEAILILQDVANSPMATKQHREALAMALASAGDVTAALKVTKVDAGKKGATEASRRARYAMMGELVRSGEPGSRAQLVAGTVQRDRYAEKIGRPSYEKPTATASNAPKKPDILAVLAGIDSRENQPETEPPAPTLRAIRKFEAQTPEIATNSGPKSLYPAQNTATNTLNLAPNDPDLAPNDPDLAPNDPDLAPNDPDLAPDGPEGLDDALTEITTETATRTTEPQKVYHVQLAAYRTTTRAEKGWKQLVLKAPAVLDGLDHVIVAPDPKFNAGGLLRLRSEACGTRAEANSLCDALKQRNLTCLVVQSDWGPGDPMPRTHARFNTAKTATEIAAK
jgi:Flp pilus assembly protein TadD